MDDGFHDRTQVTNLRAALDILPPGTPLPTTLSDVVAVGVGIVAADVFTSRIPPLTVVRFGADEVSLWHADDLVGVSIEDFLRAVAGRFDPPATALVSMMPTVRPPQPLVRGLHVRAMIRDEIADLTLEVANLDLPLAARSLKVVRRQTGVVTDARGDVLRVPPTVPVRLPMLGAAEA